MSERYAACRRCKGMGDIQGDECLTCGGTGFDGSADALRERQVQADDKTFYSGETPDRSRREADSG